MVISDVPAPNFSFDCGIPFNANFASARAATFVDSGPLCIAWKNGRSREIGFSKHFSAHAR